MIRILGTTLAGLLGLAFGSFLNVCLSRWPEGESVVKPRSHCRSCGRTLTWWENVPLVSWIALRGRCRTCQTKISWRYPLVEFALGVLWATIAWQRLGSLLGRLASEYPLRPSALLADIEIAVGTAVFCFLLLGLAALDAEQLWLPDAIMLPGIALGILYSVSLAWESTKYITIQPPIWRTIAQYLVSILAAAGIILLIRWTYWLIRRREGIGLGDAKLMAMLGAWLGLSGALLSLAVGVLLGTLFSLVVLVIPAARRGSETWHLSKLPLGTFLCVGGIISALWGPPIIAAYLRLVGLT